MKIVDARVHLIEVDSATIWVILELLGDDQTAGFGEALLPGRERLVAQAIQAACTTLLGTPVECAAPPRKPLADEAATGLFEATVAATVDQALWDLRARRLGQPLYKLLGPRLRSAITLYANINRGTRDRSPRGFAERAKEACEAGFHSIKIAPFDNFNRANAYSQSGRDAFSQALDRIMAVRDAIGFDRRLMIDCHCRFDTASALRFLDATQSVRIDWFEDVLPYRDLAGWEHLRGVTRAPLVGGETARGIRDLVPFMERGIWDVVMPDIRFFGGVSELVALAPLAEQYGVRIAPHNPRGPVATLASAHAMAGCAIFEHLEYQFRECDWRDALTRHSEHIIDGELHLKETPGIGMGWDPDVAALHRLDR
ncbi:MAG: mandelate racemase/muconate lactonizing enzyme family protein [Chromatiales bacterium]|jgi:galactonate dehydratase|nr:mandelate racemase/muconate lactonizing enzyme family protein [Chromatiales bacterium]